MNVFHFTDLVIPWVWYAIAVIAVALAGVFFSYRFYDKREQNKVTVNHSKASVWAAAILTGIAAGFILTTILIIITSNMVQNNDESDRQKLDTYVKDNYGLTVDKDQSAVLYWSQDEGTTPVTATTKDGQVVNIYLDHYKDGWTIYDNTTKKPLPQK
jgi:NADH:ubiquinone oxidoreductase subunit 5 (subunit L)/multisubunit Na+/H+ antiporter MnhA subunit